MGAAVSTLVDALPLLGAGEAHESPTGSKSCFSPDDRSIYQLSCIRSHTSSQLDSLAGVAPLPARPPGQSGSDLAAGLSTHLTSRQPSIRIESLAAESSCCHYPRHTPLHNGREHMSFSVVQSARTVPPRARRHNLHICANAIA